MSFTNLLYLYGFFPLAFLGYLPLSRGKYRNLYLLAVSLLFYAWGSLQSLFILCFVLVWNWLNALQLGSSEDEHKRKKQLAVAVGVNLLVLVMYKYVNPWIADFNAFFGTAIEPVGWVIPMGLSFYMFSCLSCLFDVYNRKADPCRSLIDFGVFAGFFAWVNMGPIAHYRQIGPQLKKHPITPVKMGQGALMLVQGLAMKVLLADNFAQVFSSMQNNTSWLGNLLLGFSYFFQLFFDFAGYSRMARGTASLFGFEVPMNFNLPYIATSISDYWRRWHISLTNWFREYIYIPLGGNRVSQKRWILNILTVWLLTGIWHGGSFHFILWGLWQALFQLLERKVYGEQLAALPAWMQHTYVVLNQLIGWTFFFAPDSLQGLSIIGRYAGIGVSGLYDIDALFLARQALCLFAAGAICSTTLPVRLGTICRQRLGASYPVVQTAGYILLLGMCTAMLISATNQTFLYAAF